MSRLSNLASGAQAGSYFDATSKDSYSNYLGTEIAVLQRTIYLPLLPQEKMTYGILKAYDYLISTDQMPESEFHPKEYWTQDDVFADFYEGNFYIPMLFPQLDSPGTSPDDMESTLVKYNAVNPDIIGGSLASEGYYCKSNYINLKVPKYIAKMFRSSIPKNTKFSVAFIGGNSQSTNICITGLISIGENDDPWSKPAKAYHTNFNEEALEVEMVEYVGHKPALYWEKNSLEKLADIIKNNIEAIEEEEIRRKEESEKFKEKENELLGGGE